MQPHPEIRPDAPPIAPGTDRMRATVRSGALEIRYLRAGSGRDVVLLSARPQDLVGGEGLLARLADHFRVTAPESATQTEPDGAATPALATCLRALLDGLGLLRVCLVANARVGTASLAFAMSEPERIERVALLRDDPEDPTAPDPLTDRLRSSGQPLFLVHHTAADCADRLARFLAAPPEECGGA